MGKSLPGKHSFAFDGVLISIIREWLAERKLRTTPEGGRAIRLTNKSGVATVKGKIAIASTSADNAVTVAGANDDECFAVFYESGIPDGSETWVVVEGIAEVLLKNNTAGTHGNWVEASDDAGYGDATSTTPRAAPDHFHEIGHCIETVSATGEGTHVLAKCVVHFN